MGIRFRCHHCEEELNVKDHLAGKKGRCPKCEGRFRVPVESAEFSLKAEEKANVSAAVGVATGESPSAGATSAGGASTGASESADSTPPMEHEQTTESQQATSGSTASATIESNAEFNVSSSASVWYVRPPSGGEYGPATASVFQGWIQENRVTPDSFVWKDGWPDWQLASTVLPNHFPGHAASQAAQPPAPQPQATWATQATPPSAASAPVANTHLPTPASTLSAAPLESTTGASNPPEPSLSERNRLTRKQKRKRNYTISIVVLSVLAVVLLAALVIALVIQDS